MQFLFNLFNHNAIGQTSLEDPMGIIGHQLQALGHKVVWEPKNNRFLMADAGINIIVEGFTEGSVEIIEQAHMRGARFIYIATEEPTPTGFNHGIDKEMVARQSMFPRAAKCCEGVLYLVPGKFVHDWFNQWSPAAYIELGHATTLVRPNDWVEPQYDFGFFGSLSRRRWRILKKLARVSGREKAVRIEATFPDQITRDRIMREAKVIVQIRKHDKMGLVSSTRCNTALCLGRPVLAEPHTASSESPWDKVVKFSDSMEEFYNDALMMKTAWKGVHSRQFQRFREMLNPQFCLGRALDEIQLDLQVRQPALIAAE